MVKFIKRDLHFALFSENQKGIVQLLVLVLIVGGIAIGAYLVQQRTNLIPKAREIQSEGNPFPEQARKCLDDLECGEGYFCQLKEDLEPIAPEDCESGGNPNCDATQAAKREYGKCLKIGTGEDEESGEADLDENEHEGEDEPKPSRSPKASKEPNPKNSD